MGEGSVDGSTADFYSGDRVQDFDSALERLKIWVLVREYTKPALVDTKADARMDVLFCGLEPSITGSLGSRT
jgi:hypothetical protein